MTGHKETSFATDLAVKTDSALTAEQAPNTEHGVEVDNKAVAADSAVNSEHTAAVVDTEAVATDSAATTEAVVTDGEATAVGDATVATEATGTTRVIKTRPTLQELLDAGAPAYIATFSIDNPDAAYAADFKMYTKSAAFAVVFIEDNVTTNPSEDPSDRYNDIVTRLFSSAEDHWPEFIPVDEATTKIMNVHTHNRPAVADGAVYVPVLAAFANHKNPETTGVNIDKWELLLVKYLVILTKVYKGRGIAAAHADGALDDYLPALEAMVAGQPHPDIKTIKHILADYFKEPLIAVRRAIIQECFSPAMRHWALDHIVLPPDSPAPSAESSASTATAGQGDNQEAKGNGEAEAIIKDNAEEATKAHAEAATKEKAEATTKVNADAEVVTEAGQAKAATKWKGKGKAKDQGEQMTEQQAEPAAGQAEH
ncbi:uncharacterized protein LOC62_06G008139 [Vanrija pseudolonga]|uniref:Uncharacterized protein n=1 Tax=Vanrija pseudolonga TaxID=143232 RepID=A0AAF0YD89_9TREE|nr:hypothetical protein LOC62_06G008139 [Vanrija pseudolonga]